MTKHVLIFASVGLLTAFACCKNSKSMSKKSEAKKEIIPVTMSNDFAKPENNDQFNIKSMTLDGDIATLYVNYQGGCKEHTFTAHFNGMYLKSLPPQATVFINHISNGDECRQVVDDTLYVDLTTVRYHKDKPGTVIVGFNGSARTLEYKHGK